MKALQFSTTGSVDNLKLVDLTIPIPDAGEVLVRVKSAGLNPSDLKNVLGRFPYTTLPRVPGRDFAGIVEQGPQELLGKAVWGTGKGPGFLRDGSHAEYLVVPASGVALKPDSLSFAQAASIGVPFTTAYDAVERTGIKHNTSFLVIGGNGAVGTAALAFAKIKGARVLAAVRKAEHAEVLRRKGYDAIVLDSTASLERQVSEFFPGGAHVIFDTTGFWLPAAVSALANFGQIAIIAAPADGMVDFPALALYRKGGVLVGVNSLLYDNTQCAAMLKDFGHYFDEGVLPRPEGVTEIALVDGITQYKAVEAGSSDKAVLIP
ncbi:Alcohol dehydrogenase zinc-binding domain protein [Pseudomonas syringae pv. helianthi]|uniref:Alcohol dehydrogenase zinc-binding domain protein n=1 Tax=Pseudomonas syringae pv. helianthi TaxID=251654 RepID=A0A0P9R2I8_9PSED|nr:zinc-binding alcohol dehydrogenase family protein [Pseudomonas syringae group genomosp. 7]KPX39354.1 Alcohol dehydrogenase zinc-binding domain protein [Pseudomonas syringae pv. helianthi]UNB65686.1 zinc-binding alcohol dehydrogenase family protein [Pseudomonas syringae pv. helianthi]